MEITDISAARLLTRVAFRSKRFRQLIASEPKLEHKITIIEMYLRGHPKIARIVSKSGMSVSRLVALVK